MGTQSMGNENYKELGSVTKWMIPAENVGTVTAEMPVLHAYELMTKQELSSLPVTENGRLLGTITRQTTAGYVPQSNQAMAQTTLNEVMTTDPLTLPPETAVQEAAKLMLAEEIDTIPIVDEANILLGIIRLEDILYIITRA